MNCKFLEYLRNFRNKIYYPERLEIKLITMLTKNSQSISMLECLFNCLIFSIDMYHMQLKWISYIIQNMLSSSRIFITPVKMQWYIFIFVSQFSTKYVRMIMMSRWIFSFWCLKWHGMSIVTYCQWPRKWIVIINEFYSWHRRWKCTTWMNWNWWLMSTVTVLCVLKNIMQ